jgi:mannose/cellobiose epimerase-like protein (N-acyl-D-glucosamine 2-epimerase family)
LTLIITGFVSVAAAHYTVSAVKAEDNASKVLPLQLKPSVDTVEGGGFERCHKLSLYGRI